MPKKNLSRKRWSGLHRKSGKGVDSDVGKSWSHHPVTAQNSKNPKLKTKKNPQFYQKKSSWTATSLALEFDNIWIKGNFWGTTGEHSFIFITFTQKKLLSVKLNATQHNLTQLSNSMKCTQLNTMNKTDSTQRNADNSTEVRSTQQCVEAHPGSCSEQTRLVSSEWEPKLNSS